MTFKTPEKFRVYVSGLAAGNDTNGVFFCKLRHNQDVRVIASDGAGWEHVSVSEAGQAGAGSRARRPAQRAG